jgi:signal peptidase II
VVICDRASKAWVEIHVPAGWRREIIPNFFYFVHSRNPGIAFSIFADSSSTAKRILLILGSLAIIAVIAWLLIASSDLSRLNATGLALLLGGAAGNVTDRIIHGSVTDFIEVWLGSYGWPAFNIADSALTVGAILVIIDIFYGRKTVSRTSGTHS